MKISVQLLPLHDARSFKSGFLAAALGVFTFAAVICNADSLTASTAETIWPTKGWQTSTPEEQGINSREIAELIDFGATHSFDSLLITRHGKIVTEAYYAPYAAGIPHAVYSVTKAVVSTLTAIAWKEGLLDTPDHRVLDFFDSNQIANLDDRKAAVTVQNLLDMTSGFDWTEPAHGYADSKIAMEHSADWVKFVLDKPMPNAPGEVFHYHGFSDRLEGSPRVNAIKGTWQGENTFLIERLGLGQGEPPERWTLTFFGGKVYLQAKFPENDEIYIEGQAGG